MGLTSRGPRRQNETMIPVNRGDVVFVDLTGAQGYETINDSAKSSRMCLVIQNNRGNAASPVTIVAPITRYKQPVSLPIQVVVREPDRGPLHQDSVIQCGQILTIDRATRITRNLGAMPSAVMTLVDAALKISLGLR